MTVGAEGSRGMRGGYGLFEVEPVGEAAAAGPSGGGGQAVQGVRPAPGPAAAPVAGRLAAPGPPRPVRRRPGRRGARPLACAGGLHRKARLPALRPAADAAPADLRLHAPSHRRQRDTSAGAERTRCAPRSCWARSGHLRRRGGVPPTGGPSSSPHASSPREWRCSVGDGPGRGRAQVLSAPRVAHAGRRRVSRLAFGSSRQPNGASSSLSTVSSPKLISSVFQVMPGAGECSPRRG